MVKLDSAIGSRVGYFGRFRDYNNSDFVMNTAGALTPTPCHRLLRAFGCIHDSHDTLIVLATCCFPSSRPQWL